MKNWGTEEWSAASVYSFIAFGLSTGNSLYRDPAVGLIAAALLIIFVYSILNYVGAKNKEIEGVWAKMDELRHEAEAKYHEAEAKYQKKIEVIKSLQAKCDRLESARGD